MIIVLLNYSILQHFKNIFCTVHYNVIIQHKPTKCTFSKSVFYFLISMSCTCFETEGSSSGRRLYIQLWYGTFEHTLLLTRLFILMHIQYISKLNSILSDRDVTSKTKTHIYHAIVKSTITYAAETGCLKAKTTGKLNSTEMDFWRRSERISRKGQNKKYYY